jgi:hypothetical protein
MDPAHPAWLKRPGEWFRQRRRCGSESHSTASQAVVECVLVVIRKRKGRAKREERQEEEIQGTKSGKPSPLSMVFPGTDQVMLAPRYVSSVFVVECGERRHKGGVQHPTRRERDIHTRMCYDSNCETSAWPSLP